MSERWSRARRGGRLTSGALGLILILGPALDGSAVTPAGASSSPTTAASSAVDRASYYARSPSATVQPDEEEVTGLTKLTILEQAGVVPPDGTARFTVDLTALTTPDSGLAIGDLNVSVIVDSILDPGADLDQPADRPLNRRPVQAATDLLAADGRSLEILIPVRGGEPFDDIDRVRIPDAGIYPVVVEIRHGETVVATGQTTLIRLPGDEAGDGTGNGEPGAAFAAPNAVVLIVGGPDGVDVGDASILLERHRGLAVTVIVTADAIDELSADQGAAAEFRAAVGERSVAPTPAPALDPSALAEIGKASLYEDAVSAGLTSLAALGLTPSSEVTIIDGPLTAAGADVLRGLGVTTAVDIGPEADGGVMSVGGELKVATPATAVSEDLASATAGEVRAERILARLALDTETSTLMVVGGGGPIHDPVAVLDPLFAVLEQPGWFGSLPLAAAGPDLFGPSLDPANTVTHSLAGALGPLNEAQDALNTYQSFYVNGQGTPGEYTDALTAALAVDVEADRRNTRIYELIDELNNSIDVVGLPANQSVTLAAQSAPIPLTVESGASGERQVLLRFRGDKIVVAEDGQVITIAPGTNSIDVAVTARSLGAFPLEVSVFTPDGRRRLATTRFQVRSTAIPGLGLAISAVGLGLLGVWWYLSIRKKRDVEQAEQQVGRPRYDSDAEVDRGGPEAERETALAGSRSRPRRARR